MVFLCGDSVAGEQDRRLDFHAASKAPGRDKEIFTILKRFTNRSGAVIHQKRQLAVITELCLDQFISLIIRFATADWCETYPAKLGDDILSGDVEARLSGGPSLSDV